MKQDKKLVPYSHHWRRWGVTLRMGVAGGWLVLALCGNAVGKTLTLDFETGAIGSLPASMVPALTGPGGPGLWRLIEDATAPSGHQVLAQLSTEKTANRFPLCIYTGVTTADVRLSVAFKAVAGAVDQAAGLMVRVHDPKNYYLVRANALEQNVRFYKVVQGKRHQLAGRDVPVPSGTWQHLESQVQGDHFQVFFNHVLLFTADDNTFRGAGRVGVWTSDFKVAKVV